MNLKDLNSIFSQAKDKKIVVIGDIMLDRYLLGNVTRISPEAPVPVFDIDGSENRLGGAANVAYNIKTLGSEPILIGVCGDDAQGRNFKKILSSLQINTKGIIVSTKRKTTSKTRVLARNQQLVRLDSEDRYDISENLENKIIKYLSKIENEFEIIILEDYNKGVLTQDLIRKVQHFADEKNKKVLVDPKSKNFFTYSSAYLFKPNKKEFEDAIQESNQTFNQIIDSAKFFLDSQFYCDNLVLTLGSEGMLLFQKGEIPLKVKSIARKVADVSGAGDTVISTIAVCLAGNSSVKTALEVSTYAAGLVVQEVGVVPIHKEKLIAYISKFPELVKARSTKPIRLKLKTR